MALWLVRAGRHGEFEEYFFDNNRIYLAWTQIQNQDMTCITEPADIFTVLQKNDPKQPPRRLQVWSHQIATFLKGMQIGDWVVLPRKTKAAIAIGEILSDYHYNAEEEVHIRHSRKVRWLNIDIPRSNFDPDILQSLSALMTICRIQRNHAEERVRAMAKQQWAKMSGVSPIPVNLNKAMISSEAVPDSSADEEQLYDLERLGRDQIATWIQRKFTGHGLAELVEAILVAQGYRTHRSPPGPDGGVDIVAGTGALGFGSPRLCVQVKSGSQAVEHKVLNELIGTMQNVSADQGLLVSWSGFKETITRQRAAQFFQVRLWDQDDLLEELFNCYEQLDPEIKTELPLKRIWSLAIENNDDSSMADLQE